MAHAAADRGTTGLETEASVAVVVDLVADDLDLDDFAGKLARSLTGT